MDELYHEVYRQLEELPIRVRVAYAAACAERVLVIFKYTSDRYFPGPQMAIDLAWSVAEGATVSDEQLAHVDQEVWRAMPEPGLGGGPDQFSCSAAGSALDAIQDPTPDHACSAVLGALFAVEQFDPEGAEEERGWQAKALELLKGNGGTSVRRDVFGELMAEKPRWLLRNE